MPKRVVEKICSFVHSSNNVVVADPNGTTATCSCVIPKVAECDVEIHVGPDGPTTLATCATRRIVIAELATRDVQRASVVIARGIDRTASTCGILSKLRILRSNILV